MSLKDLVSKGLSPVMDHTVLSKYSHACVWFPGTLGLWWMHVPGCLVLDFLPSPLLPTESNTQPHILRLNNILKTTLEEKAGIRKGTQKPPAFAPKPSIEKLSIHKWIYPQNRNRLTDTENRLWLPRGTRVGEGRTVSLGLADAIYSI